MAPRKKIGRSTAEAAYAALLKENTLLVGDVGEAWSALDAGLIHAAGLRESYEQARATAIKAGAVTNDQLDQMGYKKTPKVPVLPERTVDEPDSALPKTPARPVNADDDHHSNGSPTAPPLASLGTPSRQEHPR